MSLMRTYRRALGLSQSAFAAQLNVPLETYRPWDAGRREPPPQLLTRARTLAGYPDETVLLPLPVLALMIGVHVRTLHAAARSGRLGVAYDTRTTFRRLRPRATLKHALDFRRHCRVGAIRSAPIGRRARLRSAAQTVRAVFPHTAFDKAARHWAERWKVLTSDGGPSALSVGLSLVRDVSRIGRSLLGRGHIRNLSVAPSALLTPVLGRAVSPTTEAWEPDFSPAHPAAALDDPVERLPRRAAATRQVLFGRPTPRTTSPKFHFAVRLIGRLASGASATGTVRGRAGVTCGSSIPCRLHTP